jgi:hypothetical protein
MHTLFNRIQDPWTEETKWHLGTKYYEYSFPESNTLGYSAVPQRLFIRII